MNSNHVILFNHSTGKQVRQDFTDMDAARIYAMRRPVFRFFLEVWSNPGCPAELLASEYLN